MSGFSADDLATETKSHLNKYIGLADQKASLLLTGQLAFLGLSVTALNEIFSINGSWFEGLVILTIASGIVGMSLSIGVIYPRTPKAQKGFIFWGNISEYDSPKKFKEEFHDLEESERSDNLVTQNYYLADVASRKYCWLRWALRATVFMVLCGAGAVAIQALI